MCNQSRLLTYPNDRALAKKVVSVLRTNAVYIYILVTLGIDQRDASNGILLLFLHVCRK